MCSESLLMSSGLVVLLVRVAGREEARAPLGVPFFGQPIRHSRSIRVWHVIVLPIVAMGATSAQTLKNPTLLNFIAIPSRTIKVIVAQRQR
jgi:hypothetical protein